MIVWFWTTLVLAAFIGLVFCIIGVMEMNDNSNFPTTRFNSEQKKQAYRSGQLMLRYGLLSIAFCWLGFIWVPALGTWLLARAVIFAVKAAWRNIDDQ